MRKALAERRKNISERALDLPVASGLTMLREVSDMNRREQKTKQIDFAAPDAPDDAARARSGAEAETLAEARAEAQSEARAEAEVEAQAEARAEDRAEAGAGVQVESQAKQAQTANPSAPSPPTGGDARARPAPRTREASQAPYTIGKLSKLAGVTERTLRHYESKGLLVPARRENGYRAYSPADAARLQRILLFRACGMDLATIRQVLDGTDADMRAALASQVEVLKARRRDLDGLIENAQAALAEQEGEARMADSKRFEALKRAAIAENERTYGAEVRKQYGDAAMDASNRALEAMDEREWNDLEALGRAIIEQLARAMETDDPESAESERLARMHAAWIRGYWGAGQYTPEAHRALVTSHVDDRRFRSYYDDRLGDGATAFLAAAVCANVR
jgi:DNA-binding transcriptional MerR regulator